MQRVTRDRSLELTFPSAKEILRKQGGGHLFAWGRITLLGPREQRGQCNSWPRDWLRDKAHVGSHSPMAQQQTSGFHGLVDCDPFFLR